MGYPTQHVFTRSMIRLALSEQGMGVDDHVRSGNQHGVRSATRADRGLAFIPKIGNLSVGEEPVTLCASAGRIGRLRIGIREAITHEIKHSTARQRHPSGRKLQLRRGGCVTRIVARKTSYSARATEQCNRSEIRK